MFAGDAVFAVGFDHPEWYNGFEHDPEEAARVRVGLLRELVGRPHALRGACACRWRESLPPGRFRGGGRTGGSRRHRCHCRAGVRGGGPRGGRPARRWWPLTCRFRPSAMWRSPATPFVGYRRSGTTNRLLG
jgi:hypothetical protein